VNFVEANRRLPARLKRLLREETSDTFTVEMLSTFPSLRAFDALAREPFVVFLEPPTVDTRILHQLALFSLVSSPSASLDEWVADHPELCRTVRIPAGLKREIRDKLDQANITERVLFPDLDGLSRWLSRYYAPAVRQNEKEKSEHRSQVDSLPVTRNTPRSPAARDVRRRAHTGERDVVATPARRRRLR
jgi:hypothetical protein